MYEGLEVWLHALLTSAVDGGEWSVSRPDRFNPESISDTHWMGGWVASRRSGHQGTENALPLQGIESQFPGCSALRLVTILTELCRLNLSNPGGYYMYHLL
jgi:hypothetical protein